MLRRKSSGQRRARLAGKILASMHRALSAVSQASERMASLDEKSILISAIEDVLKDDSFKTGSKEAPDALEAAKSA